jgi:hypothetical protein
MRAFPSLPKSHLPLPGLALLFLLAGCAVAPRYPAGQAILKGETPVFPPSPDSLRTELELTAFGDGRKSSVSAAFSAKPWASYKLDLFGLPGMVAGSFLWMDGRWTLVLFDREEAVEGAGEHVEIGNLGLREISVHDMFSFLWGDFFPGDSAVQAAPEGLTPMGGNAFSYPARGMRWRVFLDPGTGLVREAVREDSAFRIGYDDYKRGGSGSMDKGRPVPRKVRLYRFREQVLEIKVKTLEDDPKWRRNPFFIKIPKGFRRFEQAPGGGSIP